MSLPSLVGLQIKHTEQDTKVDPMEEDPMEEESMEVDREVDRGRSVFGQIVQPDADSLRPATPGEVVRSMSWIAGNALRGMDADSDGTTTRTEVAEYANGLGIQYNTQDLDTARKVFVALMAGDNALLCQSYASAHSKATRLRSSSVLGDAFWGDSPRESQEHWSTINKRQQDVKHVLENTRFCVDAEGPHYSHFGAAASLALIEYDELGFQHIAVLEEGINNSPGTRDAYLEDYTLRLGGIRDSFNRNHERDLQAPNEKKAGDDAAAAAVAKVIEQTKQNMNTLSNALAMSEFYRNGEQRDHVSNFSAAADELLLGLRLCEEDTPLGSGPTSLYNLLCQARIPDPGPALSLGADAATRSVTWAPSMHQVEPDFGKGFVWNHERFTTMYRVMPPAKKAVSADLACFVDVWTREHLADYFNLTCAFLERGVLEEVKSLHRHGSRVSLVEFQALAAGYLDPKQGLDSSRAIQKLPTTAQHAPKLQKLLQVYAMLQMPVPAQAYTPDPGKGAPTWADWVSYMIASDGMNDLIAPIGTVLETHRSQPLARGCLREMHLAFSQAVNDASGEVEAQMTTGKTHEPASVKILQDHEKLLRSYNSGGAGMGPDAQVPVLQDMLKFVQYVFYFGMLNELDEASWFLKSSFSFQLLRALQRRDLHETNAFSPAVAVLMGGQRDTRVQRDFDTLVSDVNRAAQEQQEGRILKRLGYSGSTSSLSAYEANIARTDDRSFSLVRKMWAKTRVTTRRFLNKTFENSLTRVVYARYNLMRIDRKLALATGRWHQLWQVPFDIAEAGLTFVPDLLEFSASIFSKVFTATPPIFFAYLKKPLEVMFRTGKRALQVVGHNPEIFLVLDALQAAVTGNQPFTWQFAMRVLGGYDSIVEGISELAGPFATRFAGAVMEPGAPSAQVAGAGVWRGLLGYLEASPLFESSYMVLADWYAALFNSRAVNGLLNLANVLLRFTKNGLWLLTNEYIVAPLTAYGLARTGGPGLNVRAPETVLTLAAASRDLQDVSRRAKKKHTPPPRGGGKGKPPPLGGVGKGTKPPKGLPKKPNTRGGRQRGTRGTRVCVFEAPEFVFQKGGLPPFKIPAVRIFADLDGDDAAALELSR